MPELRLHRRLDEIPASAWDALNRGGHPFTSHAFLAGLETHGCLDPEYGWTLTPHSFGSRPNSLSARSMQSDSISSMYWLPP